MSGAGPVFILPDLLNHHLFREAFSVLPIKRLQVPPYGPHSFLLQEFHY